MRNHADLPQIAPLHGQVELRGYLRQVGTITISCTGDAAQNNLPLGEAYTAGYVIGDIGIASISMECWPTFVNASCWNSECTG